MISCLHNSKYLIFLQIPSLISCLKFYITMFSNILHVLSKNHVIHQFKTTFFQHYLLHPLNYNHIFQVSQVSFLNESIDRSLRNLPNYLGHLRPTSRKYRISLSSSELLMKFQIKLQSI